MHLHEKHAPALLDELLWRTAGLHLHPAFRIDAHFDQAERVKKLLNLLDRLSIIVFRERGIERRALFARQRSTRQLERIRNADDLRGKGLKLDIAYERQLLRRPTFSKTPTEPIIVISASSKRFRSAMSISYHCAAERPIQAEFDPAEGHIEN